MHLYQLNIQDFKNYGTTQVSFSGKVTSLVGANGSGKTNILDAIHYLSFCKSYFNVVDAYSIRHGMEQFAIAGRYRDEHGGSSDMVQCQVRRGQRKIFRVNGKEVERLADHIGKIPAVMVSPYDSNLIDGGSEERRRYIDMVISQYDKIYLDDLIAYNRALAQRNALLKQMAGEIRFDRLLLDPWDEQLVQYGVRIFQRRQAFIDQFIPVFTALYRHLSGDNEASGMEYLSQLNGSEDMMLLMQNAIEKDRAARYTTQGIHKDDLQFTLSGVPVKRFGSQGQQKSFIVALKLSQFAFLHQVLGVKPLLLLDDIFDKLDRGRIERLMELVSNDQYGQILITDTNAQRIETIFGSISAETDIIEVENGHIRQSMA
jgi:DNA replication and repair protein RecF